MSTTHILDPIYHSNKRTEFRIPSDGRVLLSGLRLVDFGAMNAKDNAGQAIEAYYLQASGILGLIRQITLLSNNQVLDQLRDASKYLTFKNLQQTNETLKNLNQYMVKSTLLVENTGDDIDMNAPLDNTVNGLQGRLNLGAVFPMLKATNTLANVHDLRLVIEYNQSASDIFVNATQPASFDISEPALLVDELLGSNADSVSKELNIAFPAVEVERINVPQHTGLQSVNNRLKAFDNKVLHSLVIMTDPDSANDVLGHNRSQPQPNERYQFTLNGRKLLPLTGIDSVNRKLAMVSDSVGTFFALQGSQYPTMSAAKQAFYVGSANDILNENSYAVVDVFATCNELVFEYQRDNGATQMSVADMYVFGRVEKYVKKDKAGRLTLGYVAV